MTQENPSLIINYANFDDSGQYICYGTDQTSTVNSPTISLTIIGGKHDEVVVHPSIFVSSSWLRALLMTD